MSTKGMENSEETALHIFPEFIELGGLAMQFAQVKRATGNLEGTNESDTDHTFMLSLLAIGLSEYDSRLDRGKVALYATIHDFPEVYAGDTPTLHPDRVDFVAKSQREAAAIERLDDQFGIKFPGLVHLIKAYELQEDLESQFVKTLDKSMPAITHIINSGTHIDSEFVSAEQVRENSIRHTEKIQATYGANHPLVIALRKLISIRFADEFEARKAKA